VNCDIAEKLLSNEVAVTAGTAAPLAGAEALAGGAVGAWVGAGVAGGAVGAGDGVAELLQAENTMAAAATAAKNLTGGFTKLSPLASRLASS
jgi:hypothetical protein